MDYRITALYFFIYLISSFEVIGQTEEVKLVPGLPIQDTLEIEWMPLTFKCIWDEDLQKVIFPKSNIINDLITYSKLKDNVKFIDAPEGKCRNGLQDIDFNRFSVIWFTIPFEGCDITFLKPHFSKQDDRYVLNVDSFKGSNCRYFNRSQFLFKVSKIPDHSIIEFQKYEKKIPNNISSQLPFWVKL